MRLKSEMNGGGGFVQEKITRLSNLKKDFMRKKVRLTGGLSNRSFGSNVGKMSRFTTVWVTPPFLMYHRWSSRTGS